MYAYSELLVLWRLIFVGVFVLIISTLNAQVVRADVGQVFGNTVILKTKHCAHGICSKKPNIDKYYFSKDGQKAFTKADYFGKDAGYIYGLAKEICVNLKSSYKKNSNKILISDTHCGTLHLGSKRITIIKNNASHDPGFGTTIAKYNLILEITPGGKCRLIKYSGSATNPAGTSQITIKGTCKVKRGRHL